MENSCMPDTISRGNSYVALALRGLSLIGGMRIEDIAPLLSGRYDRELKVAMFNILNKKLPINDLELEWESVVSGVERIKNHFRFEMQALFNMASEQDRLEATKQRELRIKELHATSQHGTVAEICAKYDFSKSEVRKMRANGTLEQNIHAKQIILNTA